jgi:hypothetical protein
VKISTGATDGAEHTTLGLRAGPHYRHRASFAAAHDVGPPASLGGQHAGVHDRD